MQQIYIARGPAEAHLVKGFLEAAGIVAVVQGENLFGVRGGVPMSSGTEPSVWVSEADVAQARRLVAEFQRGARSSATAWRCPNCGEMLEGQFTACWNCGTSRDMED